VQVRAKLREIEWPLCAHAQVRAQVRATADGDVTMRPKTRKRDLLSPSYEPVRVRANFKKTWIREQEIYKKDLFSLSDVIWKIGAKAKRDVYTLQDLLKIHILTI